MHTLSPHISRLLVLALMTLLVACAHQPTSSPSPSPTWWTARAASSATGQASDVAGDAAIHGSRIAGTGEAGPQATTAGTPTTPYAAAPTTPGLRRTAAPLSMPAVVGAYVTEYLPAWGERPSGMAVLGDRVYVANQHSHNVSIIAGEAVERVVPVGTFPGAMAADEATGRVFVLNYLDNTIAALEQEHVVATWELPEACTALAVAGQRLWVGSAQGGRIHLLATDDGALLGEATLGTDGSVIAMIPSPEGTTMYVASYNRTTALDAETWSEIAHAELNSYRTLAISADGRRLYANDFRAEDGTSYLVALDAATLRELGRLPLPPDPTSALADREGDRVYVLSSYANALLVIDGAAMELIATIPVGLEPQDLAAEPASNRLYVANQGSDSVTVIDTERLARVATVPLAVHVGAMSVDAETGTLYVAVSSSDRVLAFGADGLQSAWYVGGHPVGVAALPGRDEVAVLLHAEARLVLLDPSGQVVADYATGRLPSGLMVDEDSGRVYAGDLLLDAASGVTETLSIRPTKGLELEVPPVRVAVDTRRGRAYAVAYNGVPGTNGGPVIAHLPEDGSGLGVTTDGRIGVVDLIYDREADCLYAPISHMSTYGLQILDAATLQERLYLPLERPPSAAALNPGTRHLWLALLPPPNVPGATDSLLLAVDTRTLGVAAEIAVEGRVSTLAVDPRANLIYAAVDRTGDILIVQDVAMPAPPRPAGLETPTPPATGTAEPGPTVTEAPAMTPTPATTLAPTETPVPVFSPTPTREEPCRLEVDPRLSDAYASIGVQELGCPRNTAVSGDWAWQPFEHGDMLWHGSSGVIYVFREDSGWRGYADDWHEEMPALGCQAEPPAGLLQPVRGFGRIWCLVIDVREGMGWGLEPERGVTGVSQEFDGGTLMRWDGATRFLRRDGTWAEP